MSLIRINDHEFRHIQLAIEAVLESKDVALVASELDTDDDIQSARPLAMRYQGPQHLFESGMTQPA